MDARADAPEPDELLAQLGWVRALAGRLVSDPDVTDDVLQQVCLLALQRVPSEARTGLRFRAWLVNVTRRLAQHSHRSNVRRLRREQIAARAEALPSTVDAVVHREALQGLVAAVTALQEPYYSVVVARYFEGRPVADIAALNGASPEAVRQQLARARQQLRTRLASLLAEDTQGRLRAALPLAALPAAGSSGPLGTLGGLLVAKAGGSKLGLGLLVLLLLVAGTWYAMVGTRQTSPGRAGGDQQISREVVEGPQSLLPGAQLESAQPLAPDGTADDLADDAVVGTTYPPGITTYVVTGRIVNDHGQPLPGAVVRSVPDTLTARVMGGAGSRYLIDLTTLPTAVTDEQGRFSLPSPWAARFSVSRAIGMQTMPVLVVDADGMARHAFSLQNHDGRDRDVGDLVVGMRSASLVARVVDSDGRPVSNVTASINSWGGTEEALGRSGFPAYEDFNLMGLSRTISDAAGRLSITGLWPSQLKLSLQDGSHEGRTLDEIRVPAGEIVDLGDVVLQRGGRIAGIVRDESGTPIAGAEIYAWDRVYAGDAGSIELQDWASGDPLAAVLDSMHEARRWNNRRSPVTSDARGLFEKTGLDEESLDVFIEAAGFDPMRIPAVRSGAADLDVVLRPETILVVAVTDESGVAIPRASLRAFRCSPPIGNLERAIASELPVTGGPAPGSFVVHAIGPRETRLIAQAPGFATESLTLATGERGPAIVRLRPPCIVGGRVEDVQGAPVAGALLTVRPTETRTSAEAEVLPAGFEDKRETRSGPDGAFRFDDLGVGRFTLDLEATGFRAPEPLVLQVGRDGEKVLPPIVLQRVQALSGTLSFADGTPAVGWCVHLLMDWETEDSRKQTLARVDRSGAFGMPDWGPGRRLVTASRDFNGQPVLRREVVIADDDARGPDLVLPRLTVVRGHVSARGGQIPECSVRVLDQPSDGQNAATEISAACDGYGSFVLDLTRDGHYRLRAEVAGGGASGARSIEAVAGETISLDFELGTASLSGRVRGAGNTLPAAAEVRIVRDGEAVTEWLSVAQDGTFRLENLLAGRCTVEARANGGPPTALPIDLKDGVEAQIVVPLANGAASGGP